MKCSIGIFGCPRRLIFAGNFIDEIFYLLQFLLSNLCRRERRGLSFEKQAGLCKFECSDVETWNLAITRQFQHESASADANFHQALHLQRNYRFANRRPANVELLHELALGRQSRPDRILARCNLGDKASRHVLVETVFWP